MKGFIPSVKHYIFFFVPSQPQKYLIYGYSFPAYLVPVEPYMQEVLCEDSKIA